MTNRKFQIEVPTRLHISIATQFFESIFAFLVLAATGTFRRFRVAQFLDNVSYSRGVGFNRQGARRTTQASVALAILVREIKRNNWNTLALDVFPNVKLRPV